MGRMGSSSDSSAKGALLDKDMIFFLATTILVLGRMWMDIFILAVNCQDWMKKKWLNHTDRILTLQGTIRICYGCVGMLWYTLAIFCPGITQRSDLFKAFVSSLWYFATCNFWLTASLCSYYCVKIADFRHPIFIHLKLRLSGLVSTWLLGSMVLPLASSLPYVYSDFEISGNRNLSQIFGNKNVTNTCQQPVALHVSALVGLGSCAAFTVCVTSAVLLLFSLWRHRQRMLGSQDSHRSPQTNGHFKALVIILSLLTNHAIIFVSFLLFLTSDFGGNWIACVAVLAVKYCCFSVDSLITVWGNKKLKNELYGALHFAKCRGHAT